jgi:hypothetical protein
VLSKNYAPRKLNIYIYNLEPRDHVPKDHAIWPTFKKHSTNPSSTPARMMRGTNKVRMLSYIPNPVGTGFVCDSPIAIQHDTTLLLALLRIGEGYACLGSNARYYRPFMGGECVAISVVHTPDRQPNLSLSVLFC